MSLAHTSALGAIAGLTIYLGLPAGRLDALAARTRVATAMFSVGVLTFIFSDVLANATSILDSALHAFKRHDGSLAHVVALVVLMGAAFATGSAGLATLERRVRPRGASTPPIAGGATAVSLSAGDARRLAGQRDAARRRALHLSLVIAAAIGVHNFAEGLAIGVSARSGAINVAMVLIVGFALHNATEGFGIVGPLSDVKPSWRWLGLAGLIGGGPTFLGVLVGYNATSPTLELAFYAVAGGAILYVIGEVWNGMRRYGHGELGLMMIAAGFVTGVITDLMVALGGG